MDRLTVTLPPIAHHRSSTIDLPPSFTIDLPRSDTATASYRHRRRSPPSSSHCIALTLRCKNNMNNLVLSLAPKFTKLQTPILRRDKPQLQDNAVETIANYCHDLQDLDLSKSFKLNDRSLFALAHGCPNLIKLNISGCTAFSNMGLAYLAQFAEN